MLISTFFVGGGPGIAAGGARWWGGTSMSVCATVAHTIAEADIATLLARVGLKSDAGAGRYVGDVVAMGAAA